MSCRVPNNNQCGKVLLLLITLGLHNGGNTQDAYNTCRDHPAQTNALALAPLQWQQMISLVIINALCGSYCTTSVKNLQMHCIYLCT